MHCFSTPPSQRTAIAVHMPLDIRLDHVLYSFMFAPAQHSARTAPVRYHECTIMAQLPSCLSQIWREVARVRLKRSFLAQVWLKVSSLAQTGSDLPHAAWQPAAACVTIIVRFRNSAGAVAVRRVGRYIEDIFLREYPDHHAGALRAIGSRPCSSRRRGREWRGATLGAQPGASNLHPPARQS